MTLAQMRAEYRRLWIEFRAIADLSKKAKISREAKRIFLEINAKPKAPRVRR